jgi:hypothetical protein
MPPRCRVSLIAYFRPHGLDPIKERVRHHALRRQRLGPRGSERDTALGDVAGEPGHCAARPRGWAGGDFAVSGDLLSPEFESHQFPQAVEPGTRRGPLKTRFGACSRSTRACASTRGSSLRPTIRSWSSAARLPPPGEAACPWTLKSPSFGLAGRQAGAQRGLHGSARGPRSRRAAE